MQEAPSNLMRRHRSVLMDHTLPSGDFVYTFTDGTFYKEKQDGSDMDIQAKVKRVLGDDLTGVGFIGFGSGSERYTPSGITVKDETKTSNFNLGAGVVKKFNSALVAAKATYNLDSSKFSDEPIYAGTYKSKSESEFTIGVGAEMAIMKGLVGRAGIWDTFSSTSKLVRADNSTEKSGWSSIMGSLGLGCSFGNYQVDLLIPMFYTSNSESTGMKTSYSTREIQLGVSAKF